MCNSCSWGKNESDDASIGAGSSISDALRFFTSRTGELGVVFSSGLDTGGGWVLLAFFFGFSSSGSDGLFISLTFFTASLSSTTTSSDGFLVPFSLLSRPSSLSTTTSSDNLFVPFLFFNASFSSTTIFFGRPLLFLSPFSRLPSYLPQHLHPHPNYPHHLHFRLLHSSPLHP